MWRRRFYGVLGTVTTGAYFGSVPAFCAESKCPTSPNDLTLQTVQIFFRHGARTPLRSIPFLEEVEWPKELLTNPPGIPSITYKLTGMDGRKMTRSPHDDKLQQTVFKGGAFAGHLTKLGKQQMYELGKKLRKEYVDKSRFLDPGLKDSEVSVRSTNILRTVESVQWLMNGLFDVEKRGKDKPVVIYTDLDEEEILYPNVNFCIRLKNVNKRFYKAVDDMPGIEKSRLKHASLLKYNAGENNDRKLDYQELRDELSARLAHDLYIPKEVRGMLDDINKYATHMLKLMVTGPDEDKRNAVLALSCGAVLNLVTTNMEAAAAGKNVPKLYLYSAHDSLVIALLLSLGLFDEKWPPFAADIVFEQYKDHNSKEWVRVLFLGKPQKLGGKNGAEFVSLKRFKELMSPFSLTYAEYRVKCGTAGDEVEGGEVMDVVGGKK